MPNISKNFQNSHKLCFSIFMLVVCLTYSTFCTAKGLQRDSLTQNSFPYFAVTSALFVGGGIWSHQTEHSYSESQKTFLPKHSSTADDIVRWLPTFSLITLRLTGKEQRSSTKRSLISRCMGYALSLGLTEGLKRGIKQRRPDGSDNKSIPSGHTATTFMSATVLDEEYGHISPLITLGGYATSAAVGFSRTVGNHHYPGDVLMGAGLGILAARMGYILTDWMIGDAKNNKHAYRHQTDVELSEHPSFLGFYGGYAISLKDLPTSEHSALSMQPGLEVGLEGAYFPWKHVGFGGQLSASHALLEQNNEAIMAWVDELTTAAGLYTSLPVGSRGHLGAKLLGGYSTQVGGRKEIRAYQAEPIEGITMETGLEGGVMLRENLDLKLGVNYKAIYGDSDARYLTPTLSMSYAF